MVIFKSKNMIFKIVLLSIAYLIILISGIWMSREKRPLNTAVFSVHKIMAVLAIVLSVIIVLQSQATTDFGKNEILSVILSAALFLISFVSGALLSFDKLVNKFLQAVHKIASFLVLAAMAITLYLMG